MILLPAIDLYEGKAVRLKKGDYAEMTVYREDPVNLASEMEAQGAEWIHIVDLEGAKSGLAPNLPIAREIARTTGLKVEYGGGLRSLEVLERCIDGGVSRAILGTAAVTDPELLAAAVARWGEKIAAGADIKDGKIAIKGWLETAEEGLEAFLDRMLAVGVQTAICTDISRDGMLKGTNRELYASLADRKGPRLVASGGVSSLEDIRALRNMGIYGAILGKAYYTGAVNLREGIEAAK
ncbi:MAG: 1-(5-phosphoribosyl)-5-[(5-phosphoribosylamino)methylideneamino]imidazole-4-carboxamide isomerase [Oscillospiraceae bacterium]|nr:1-(5-phosphoribosyl)-5-[(5-phosphoribosylamino)methylideneamino]imidazole-4-carboxamide isomerase [Oscillospiraceae bacterium]